MLIAARALQALGGSGGIVLARAIVRDLYSGARAGRELSLIGSVMALAPVLAPIVGGVLQTGFGWRSIFFTLVAAGVFGAGTIWLLLPETLGRRAAEPVSPSSMLKSYRVVARNPAYLAYLGLAVQQLCRIVRLDFRRVLRAARSLQAHAVRLRRRLRGRLGRLHDRRGAGRAAGGQSRPGPHHRFRRLRLRRRRSCHDGGAGSGLDVGGLAGAAGGDLSRRAGHGACRSRLPAR